MRRKDRFTMGRHIMKSGFTPGYHRWIHHGEANRIREEMIRPWLEAFNDDAEVPDMMDDFHQAQFAECHEKEDIEATIDAFYLMLYSAQRPLHDRTNVSQLDAIGRVMGLKAELNLRRLRQDGGRVERYATDDTYYAKELVRVREAPSCIEDAL